MSVALHQSLLLGSSHLSQLSINSLKAVKYLSKLSLADLEHDLLVLGVPARCLVFLQIHLHVECRLLYAILLP